jgi:hypothetical protein
MKNTVLLITYFFQIIAVIIFLSGIIPTVGGLVWWRYVHNWAQSAERVDGTVIELVERNTEGGKTYSPVVEFSDSLGQRHEYHSSTSSYPPRHAVGEKVPMLYDRDNPKSATIHHWFYLYFGPGICFSIGIVSIFLALILFVAAWLAAHRATRLAK